MARHASKQIQVRWLFSAALAAAAALGLAGGSRAAVLAATSGGLSAIQVDTGESFVVDFRLDTEGERTAGYGFLVTWDGGPVAILTVETPFSPDPDTDGDIFELDPDGDVPEGRGLDVDGLVDSYVASTAGTAGTIFVFFALDFTSHQDFIINGGVARVTFKAISEGTTTVSAGFADPQGAVFGPRGDNGEVVCCLPTTLEALTVNVGPAPHVTAAKSDAQISDANGDGDVDPGDTLRYTVVIGNDGVLDAEGVVFSDTPDANAPLIPGSVTTTQGTVTLGNGAADASLEVEIGTVPAGGSATVSFDVAVADPLPEGVFRVSNQGLVAATNFGQVQTDDPDTDEPADATDTPVVYSPLAECREDLASLESDLAACSADLGVCIVDLGSCQQDLGEAQDDLAECQNDPPFEDADGDGEHDDTDACPGTPAGEPVDPAGCSIAQFCAGFAVAGTSRNSPCNQADWGNDEPLGAEDCKVRNDQCEPR